MFPIIPGQLLNLTELMQNASKKYSRVGFCNKFQFNTTIFISPAISGIGLILNFLNILVFTKTTKKIPKGNMIKYLIAKSVFDFCYCSIIVIDSFDFSFKYSYYYQIYRLCIHYYLKHVVIFLSVAFDCLAIISRYSLITKRIQWSEKITVFNRGMPIFTSFGLLIYSYKFIEYSILPYKSVNNISVAVNFTIEASRILSIKDRLTIELVQTTLVNLICPSIILIFNILTALEIKNKMRNKRRLSASKSIHERIKRSEIRNTLMLILASPLTIFPNYVFFVIAALTLISFTQFYNACFDNIGNIVFYAQFTFSLFFYFAFNVNFKNNFKKLICLSK